MKIYLSFVEDFEEHLDPIEFCYQKTLAKHPPKTNLKLIFLLYIKSEVKSSLTNMSQFEQPLEVIKWLCHEIF